MRMLIHLWAWNVIPELLDFLIFICSQHCFLLWSEKASNHIKTPKRLKSHRPYRSCCCFLKTSCHHNTHSRTWPAGNIPLSGTPTATTQTNRWNLVIDGNRAVDPKAQNPGGASFAKKRIHAHTRPENHDFGSPSQSVSQSGLTDRRRFGRKKKYAFERWSEIISFIVLRSGPVERFISMMFIYLINKRFSWTAAADAAV